MRYFFVVALPLKSLRIFLFRWVGRFSETAMDRSGKCLKLLTVNISETHQSTSLILNK